MHGSIVTSKAFLNTNRVTFNPTIILFHNKTCFKISSTKLTKPEYFSLISKRTQEEDLYLGRMLTTRIVYVFKSCAVIIAEVEI